MSQDNILDGDKNSDHLSVSLILSSSVGALFDHSFIHFLKTFKLVSARLLTKPSMSCSATPISAFIATYILLFGVLLNLASSSAIDEHAFSFIFRRLSFNNSKSCRKTLSLDSSILESFSRLLEFKNLPHAEVAPSLTK
jgi:hypothetical protein